MELRIDDDTRKALERASELGEKEYRPAGLEADRSAAPRPVGHPFFDGCIERGEGRTRWAGPGPDKGASAPKGSPPWIWPSMRTLILSSSSASPNFTS